MTEKKNTDYSASAVNLINPPQVEGLLRDLQTEQISAAQLRNQADALIPDELKTKIKQHDDRATKLASDIRKAIDELGSYQDLVKGWYAIKQRRESVIYKPELVRQYAPSKVASFVLVESVDSKALDALVKAGQITPEVAKQCGEIKESFAYIIK